MSLYFPNRVIVIIFLPFIRIPTRTFVLGYGIVELFLGVTNTTSGVTHFAHLGGLFGGWLGVQYFRGRRAVRQTLRIDAVSLFSHKREPVNRSA